VFDVIDRRGERSFLAVNKPLSDLVGWQSGITPNHADHRNVNRWKNIGRRLGQNERSHQKQQQRCYHKRVRPI